MTAADVRVTGHAVTRARDRRHFAGQPAQRVGAAIAAEVADAIRARRVSSCKPAWTKLVTRAELGNRRLSLKPVECEPGTRFVWNADETLGWVVKDEDGLVVVLTSLHRVRSAEACAA